MGQSLVQNTDGSAGLAGSGGGTGEMVVLTFTYDANSVDRAFFTASRKYIVKSIICRPTVAGTDAGAVTAGVNIADDGTAIPAGQKIHASTMDLKGTIHTNQVMSVTTTSDTNVLNAGQSIGVNFTGTMTAAVGVISVTMCPA